jgi:hypothetical protein
MRGAGRLRRWLSHPTGSAIAACILCALLTYLATIVRMAGPLGFVPLAGLVLLLVTLLLVVYRLGQALASRASHAALQHAAQLGLLLVVNFMLLALVLAAIGGVVGALWPATNVPRIFAALMAATLCAGAWIGGAGGVLALAVAAVISVCRLAQRVPGVATMDSIFTRLVWILVIIYAVYVPALTISLAPRWFESSPTEVVVGVRNVAASVGQSGIVWVEVESWWRPGAVERILLLPGGDEGGVWRITAGRRLRLDTGPGPFGVPWVANLRVEVDEALPELVAAVPTAEWPRKWLMGDLTRRGRWAELVEQARQYHRYHPTDRATIARVLFSLRAGGQVEAARVLETELGMRARPSGPIS